LLPDTTQTNELSFDCYFGSVCEQIGLNGLIGVPGWLVQGEQIFYASIERARRRAIVVLGT
jgi:hypothetical protein